MEPISFVKTNVTTFHETLNSEAKEGIKDTAIHFVYPDSQDNPTQDGVGVYLGSQCLGEPNGEGSSSSLPEGRFQGGYTSTEDIHAIDDYSPGVLIHMSTIDGSHSIQDYSFGIITIDFFYHDNAYRAFEKGKIQYFFLNDRRYERGCTLFPVSVLSNFNLAIGAMDQWGEYELYLSYITLFGNDHTTYTVFATKDEANQNYSAAYINSVYLSGMVG